MEKYWGLRYHVVDDKTIGVYPEGSNMPLVRVRAQCIGNLFSDGEKFRMGFHADEDQKTWGDAMVWGELRWRGGKLKTHGI